jgi:predicted permease
MATAMRERDARRLLALLLRLYPHSFRWDVGADLVTTSLDRWRETRRVSGTLGELHFWLTEGSRFVVDGVLERSRSVATGAATELRHAIRQLLRAPRHYGVAVVTLALGIGATTAIYTVADAVVFRPLPYADAERLHLVHTRYGALELSSNSLPNLLDVREQVTAMDWLAGAADRSPVLSADGEDPERIAMLDVTDDYLAGFGARVFSGRSFGAADFAADGERVAIVSHGLWQRRWGSDPGLIGRAIQLDGTAYTVIGVMQPSFRDPEPIETGSETGAWAPARVGSGIYSNRDHYAFHLVGRLAAGTSLEVARQQFAAVSASLSAAHPEANRIGGDALEFMLRPLREATVGEARARVLMLLGAVVLLLVLSCANVANLFLARGHYRSTELAVRSALGASRARLASQLFGESLLTAAAASLVGVVLASYAVQAFVAAAPAGIPRLHEAALDARVLGFVVLLTMATSVVFGTLPATRGAATAMRTMTGGRTTSARNTQRVQSTLLGAEVALSLVLLTSAALLLNSFRHLLGVEPGFTAEGLVVVDVRPPRSAATHERTLQFYDELAAHSAALPGVQQAALIHSVPGVHGGAWSRITVDGGSGEGSQRATAPIQTLLDPGEEFFRLNPVRGDAFGALGMPIVAGRPFAVDAGPGDPLTVVINEAAARRLFPGVDAPLGRMIAIGNPGTDVPMREIVGIVGNVRQRGAAREPDAQIYLPHGQRDIGRMALVLKLTPGSIIDATAIRQVTRDVAPDLPIDRIDYLAERYSATASEQRFLLLLLSAFAALGLVLAMVGTYATAAQTAARRLHEFGVRVAFGAAAGALFRLVVFRTLAVAGVGITCGLLLTVVLTRFLESYVFGISARDPLTFGVAAILIALTATAASVVPAIRAASTDPNVVLRRET